MSDHVRAGVTVLDRDALAREGVGRPLLIDLYCKAGGAAMGYHRAGFRVVGVDIEPQPHYPFEFRQADALEFLESVHWACSPTCRDGFRAVHASPPCNDHSQLHKNYGAPSHGTGHLLAATLERLRDVPVPWVVENVMGALMPSPFTLCGASFGLGASGLDLNRHRQFSTNFPMLVPPCSHRRGKTIGVYGNGTNKWHREKLGRNLTTAEQREAMGIDWMNRAELAQAIPPAYTEYIGGYLMAALDREVEAV